MKSQINVEKSYVLNAELPNHGDSYTVISHKYVIDTTKQMLVSSGFIITKEYYRANNKGQVAQGIYHIRPMNVESTDPDLGMMFAWTNSYDKSIRFQCAIGAYVMACSNGMVCGELNYARKHTGSADQEIRSQISRYVPSVNLLEINMPMTDSMTDNGEMSVIIRYSIVGQRNIDELEINLFNNQGASFL